MSKPQSWPLQGPAGSLQAVLELTTTQPGFVAVICHPHPLFGGTMDNKVVTTLARAARDAGAAVIRFNFRGVGESQGAYGEGNGETEDLLAAVSALRHQFADLPLWLAGFSFGSYVAARGAAALYAAGAGPSHLMLVAPPVQNFDFAPVSAPGCPVTVVQGDEDEVVEATAVHQWVEETALQPELIRFPECGHFFHGRLGELRALAETRFPGAM